MIDLFAGEEGGHLPPEIMGSGAGQGRGRLFLRPGVFEWERSRGDAHHLMARPHQARGRDREGAQS